MKLVRTKQCKKCPWKGVPGATWGDTEYDSMAAAAGYNQAVMNMKTLLVDALTPKTGEDE